MNISRVNSVIWFEKVSLKWFIKDGDFDEKGTVHGPPSLNGTFFSLSTLHDQ
jgi:hypothetical protein